MSDTRQLICEGACNPLLSRLDEQRIAATIRWRPERVQMPSMPKGWVEQMRQQVHTPHHRMTSGVPASIWICNVCHAKRKW